MSKHLVWPFSIPDWKRDTPHLAQSECAAYANLLMYYWEHGGLPEDDEALRRIAGAESVMVWREQRRKLKRFFHDGWKHKRMDADLARAASNSAIRRRAALRRWDARPAVDNVDNKNISRPYQRRQKQKQNQRPVDANGMLGQCSLVKQYKLPSISGSTDAVNKSGQPKQASDLERHAAQAWQRDMLRNQGSELYAVAIDRLANAPDIVENATRAEMTVPGTGNLVAMLMLSVREGKS